MTTQGKCSHPAPWYVHNFDDVGLLQMNKLQNIDMVAMPYVNKNSGNHLSPLIRIFLFNPYTDYSSQTKPISWLPMPRLIASPGHRHPCHWLCEMLRSFNSMFSMVNINGLWLFRVMEDIKDIYIYWYSSFLKNNYICSSKHPCQATRSHGAEDIISHGVWTNLAVNGFE